jgi:hypothetical protein
LDWGAALKEWLNLLYVICGLLASFLLYLLYFAQEAKLEKAFRKLAEAASGWFPYCSFHPPSFILVSIYESKFSPLRHMLRRCLLRVTHWRSLRRTSADIQKIIVTETISESEQQVKIAQECVRSLQGVELLDPDFLFSLRQYLAYKHAKDYENILGEARETLRTNFESCSLHDKMLTLDDHQSFLNITAYPLPHSETRPKGEATILADIILPLVRERAKELEKAGAQPTDLDKETEKIMTIIDDLIHLRMGVVFIGEKSEGAYREAISAKLKLVGRVMLSARGSHVYKMILIVDSMEKLISKRDTIAGEWTFYETKKTVPVLWIIVEGKLESKSQQKLVELESAGRRLDSVEA